jgi:hypothetical protein
VRTTLTAERRAQYRRYNHSVFGRLRDRHRNSTASRRQYEAARYVRRVAAGYFIEYEMRPERKSARR